MEAESLFETKKLGDNRTFSQKRDGKKLAASQKKQKVYLKKRAQSKK